VIICQEERGEKLISHWKSVSQPLPEGGRDQELVTENEIPEPQGIPHTPPLNKITH